MYTSGLLWGTLDSQCFQRGGEELELVSYHPLCEWAGAETVTPPTLEGSVPTDASADGAAAGTEGNATPGIVREAVSTSAT